MTVEEFIAKHQITMRYQRVEHLAWANRFDCTLTRPREGSSPATLTVPMRHHEANHLSMIPRIWTTLEITFTHAYDVQYQLNYRAWLTSNSFFCDTAESWREYGRRQKLFQSMISFLGSWTLYHELKEAVLGRTEDTTF